MLETFGHVSREVLGQVLESDSKSLNRKPDRPSPKRSKRLGADMQTAAEGLKEGNARSIVEMLRCLRLTVLPGQKSACFQSFELASSLPWGPDPELEKPL